MVALPPLQLAIEALVMWPARSLSIFLMVALWKLPSSVTAHVVVLPPAISLSAVHLILKLLSLILSLLADACATQSARISALAIGMAQSRMNESGMSR